MNSSTASERVPSRAAVFNKESARSLPIILQCAGIQTNIKFNPSENIESRHSFFFIRISKEPVSFVLLMPLTQIGCL